MSGVSVRSIVSGFLLACLAAVPAARAQVVRQVTHGLTSLAGPGALDDAGRWVFTGSSTDQLGNNPDHSFQVFRFDAVTGAGEKLTDFLPGTAAFVSVSDDGEWIAFTSPADLVGRNHDMSPELYAMKTDGSEIRQLTDDPAPNAGSVTAVALAGGGSRVAFVSNCDYLGENPDHQDQVFVVDLDGTNLRQLTHFGAARGIEDLAGGFGGLAISDDGERIVFASRRDPLGTNPEGNSEIFAVNADGSGLRQLTSAAEGDSTAVQISGNGALVVFQSDADLTGGNGDRHDEIFAVNWDGSGLRQVTDTNALVGDPQAQSPSVTDDAEWIVFHSNHVKGFTNLDSNYEIWKVHPDGSGLDNLTSTSIDYGSFFPVVSGDGTRVAFYSFNEFSGGHNPDGNAELHAMDINGDGIVQLSDTRWGFSHQPDVAADGSWIVFSSDAGLLGGSGGEIYAVRRDGGDLARVTDLSSGDAQDPSVTADGWTIVFAADSNDAGGNLDLSTEIFLVHRDGSGLARLSDGDAGTKSSSPVIAADGSVVFYDSDADPVGGNGDGSREIFRVQPDGSGTAQLTDGPDGTSSRHARCSRDGSVVVFESNANLDGTNPDGTLEVFVVNGDGTGLRAITADPSYGSDQPDVDAAGKLVAFSSTADPAGNNPEHNREIFVHDLDAGTTTQLTSFSRGDSDHPRFSRDGRYVFFLSSAPVTEEDPDEPTDLYRVEVSTGEIVRVGGLRFGVPERPAVDETGGLVAFSGVGEFTSWDNPDLMNEIWVIDGTTPPSIRVGKEQPTLVSWDVESGPIRYDVIRGDCGQISGAGPADTVDLGPVSCLENDSPDADTRGDEDPDSPAAGHGFFFLYRGSPGLLAGPGSYGLSSDGRERQPSSGDCP